jgi:hypothetical protein
MTINKVCLVGRLGANPESIWGESGCRTKHLSLFGSIKIPLIGIILPPLVSKLKY